MKKYFVTGIGTNVGKTIASAILVEALRADYWKPIQCGTEDGTDSLGVRDLISNNISKIHPEAYVLKKPASPHIAAKEENKNIALDSVTAPVSLNKLIIEGAGGILVPLNEKNYVIELAQRFDAKVILVVQNYLGCINHSLLSMDYLFSKGYKIKGLILNGDFEEGVKSAILSYKPVNVLAEFPHSVKADKKFVAEQASKINIYNF